MSGAVQSSDDTRPLSRRLRRSPLRDLVRGRVTGRLDVAWEIERAGLPPELALVVSRVAKRTRLWRSERVETARELAAHFRDGLAAGRSGAELVRDFGDERAAARLIRRAARRKRPVGWHVWARLCQAGGCVLLVLLVMVAWDTIRYLTASPTISRNYMAELNAPILARPENERAWPLYREAILKLADIGPIPKFTNPDGTERWITPDDPEWPQMTAYLDSAGPALELVRRASERPILGAPLVAKVDPELKSAMERFSGEPRPMPTAEEKARDDAMQAWIDPENPPLIGTLLPHLGPMRRIARILCEIEVAQCVKVGDAVGLERAVTVAFALARQVGAGTTVIEQLVGQALSDLAVKALSSALGRRPDLLPDAALTRIAHRISATGAGTNANLLGERLMMHDLTQRVFTDDGAGDGVMTRAGWDRYTGGMSFSLGNGVLWSPVVAGRRDLLKVWDQYYDKIEAAAQSAEWADRCQRLDAEVEAVTRNGYTKLRYPMLSILLPALSRFVTNSHESAMRRDCAQAGLALELHRRRTGEYPRTLEALTPGLLPAVPIDGYSRTPVKYKLVDGRPVIYSVGNDGVDDDGMFKGAQPGYRHDKGHDLLLWPAE